MRPRRRLRAWFILTNTVLLWATLAVATFAWWPVYEHNRFVLLAAVTVLIGSAIAIGGALLRWPSLLVMLTGIATFLLTGVSLAVPHRADDGLLPTLGGLRELLGGLAGGWKQLLTISLPVGTYEALLVPVFALLLAVSIVSLSVALRSARGELGAIGPTLVYLTGIAIGPEREHWPVASSLTLLVLTLGWASWLRWYRRQQGLRSLTTTRAQDAAGTSSDRRRIAVRAAVAAAVTLAVAAAAGVTATAAAPPGEKRVLRTAVEQPFDPRDWPSPLSGFRAYHQPPAADRPMLTVTGLPAQTRIRLAALDTYDGIVFSVGSSQVDSASGVFSRVPTTVDTSDAVGEPAQVHIRVQDYRGPWLPGAGALSRATFEGPRQDELQQSFFYNTTASTAVVVSGLEPGDQYTLDTLIPTRQPAVSSLSPGDAPVPRATRLPETLDTVIARYSSDGFQPGEALAAVLAGITRDGYVSHGVDPSEPPSRSGHAADRIDQLFTDAQMIGDDEQYAVAVALIARKLGFPSRVVVGFTPDARSGQGSTTVRGADLAAWVEIHTAEGGWVSIQATPPEREIPDLDDEEAAAAPLPQTPVQPPPPEPQDRQDQLPPQTSPGEPEPETALWEAILFALRVAAVAVGVITLLLLPFLVVLLVKAVRRFRRRRGRPHERVRGGWDEFEDAARDYGYELPPAGTRREIARAIGGARPSVLASVVDRALLSPEGTTAHEADRIWLAVMELRAALGRSRTRLSRLRAAASRRSLRRSG